jgi:hypothetical protein
MEVIGSLYAKHLLGVFFFLLEPSFVEWQEEL